MTIREADAVDRRTRSRQSVKRTGAADSSTKDRMTAPKSGVKVRMYRQGHGDCFLLAFRGKKGKPVYVLIDCGYKPGSNGSCYNLREIGDVIEDIKVATGAHLDLVVITHEHQDHVNGFWKKEAPPFEDFKVGAAWFAWTEDPEDSLANELRERHRDQLLGLIGARNRLAVANGDDNTEWLDDLLTLELGLDFVAGETRASQFAAAANDRKKKNPENSVNKQGMKLIKDKATEKNVKYIKPHDGIHKIPGVEGVRVFAFGPPYDASLIADEDPKGSEAFPDNSFRLASFLFAVREPEEGEVGEKRQLSPFARRFTVPWEDRFKDERCKEFLGRWYGCQSVADKTTGTSVTPGAVPPPSATVKSDELRDVLPGADWRRIDTDWLHSAEQFALALNRGVNNTSLVLAFELTKSGKVLLFVGDAQRGNWISWTAGEWKDDDKKVGVKRDGDKKITARDLMARTVLYKVGHHGSHNATLSGTADDPYPNLAWMGRGKYANEFTAMITAVSDWAHHKQKPPWNHPLESIKEALLDKAENRVFQTDTEIDVTEPHWKACKGIKSNALYFEYEIYDAPPKD